MLNRRFRQGIPRILTFCYTRRGRLHGTRMRILRHEDLSAGTPARGHWFQSDKEEKLMGGNTVLSRTVRLALAFTSIGFCVMAVTGFAADSQGLMKKSQGNTQQADVLSNHAAIGSKGGSDQDLYDYLHNSAEHAPDDLGDYRHDYRTIYGAADNSRRITSVR